MPLPRLIHPVAVEIETFERTETLVDADYREPISHAARGETTTVLGQMHWTIDDRVQQTLMGPEREATGYILFRIVDLKRAGIGLLENGDRFTSIGHGENKIDVDFYVIGLRMIGHWPDQGGATLVRAFYRDRSQTKDTPTGEAT
jgi:hypothetical protein